MCFGAAEPSSSMAAQHSPNMTLNYNLLHCSTVKMFWRLKLQIFTNFRMPNTNMTIKTVKWLYFQKSGVGPNLYTFHCFWHWVALSNKQATLTMKWMTKSAPKHLISLFAVHQKGEVMKWAKWMMQRHPRYLKKTTCCISVSARELHCTHLCCSFHKVSFCTIKSLQR